MKKQKQREIVIEYEHVRIIRKRARTHLLFCAECGQKTDFISLSESSALFCVEAEKIFQFIKADGSHYQTGPERQIFICLPSLIARMRLRKKIYSYSE